MNSQRVITNTGSQYLCVNGAIIVNAFYEKGFCFLFLCEWTLIDLLLLVNRHTPSFPVELSNWTYGMLTASFTMSIE